MEIDVTEVRGITVVAFRGELTWKSAPEVQASASDAVRRGRQVILDLSRVSYISSAGLRLLLVVYRQVTGQGGQALCCGLSSELKDTLNLTGFLDFFAHCDNLEAGLAQLDA
jgi:anti-sigma B factor antagonist